VRHARITRRPDGRLSFEIERHEMGKKYDDYAKAARAEDMAKARVVSLEGGSTRAAMTEAVNNARSAEVVSNVLWNELMDDPNG
jgi:hypothetical protein